MSFSFLQAEIDFAHYYCTYIKGTGSQGDPKKLDKNGHKAKLGTRKMLYSSEAPPIFQHIKNRIICS